MGGAKTLVFKGTREGQPVDQSSPRLTVNDVFFTAIDRADESHFEHLPKQQLGTKRTTRLMAGSTSFESAQCAMLPHHQKTKGSVSGLRRTSHSTVFTIENLLAPTPTSNHGGAETSASLFSGHGHQHHLLHPQQQQQQQQQQQHQQQPTVYSHHPVSYLPNLGLADPAYAYNYLGKFIIQFLFGFDPSIGNRSSLNCLHSAINPKENAIARDTSWFLDKAG